MGALRLLDVKFAHAENLLVACQSSRNDDRHPVTLIQKLQAGLLPGIDRRAGSLPWQTESATLQGADDIPHMGQTDGEHGLTVSDLSRIEGIFDSVRNILEHNGRTLVLETIQPGKEREAVFLARLAQKARAAGIPVLNYDRQIRSTADRVVSAKNDVKRAYYYDRLLGEMNEYQQKLVDNQAPLSVTGPVKRLADMLHRYRHALID